MEKVNRKLNAPTDIFTGIVSFVGIDTKSIIEKLEKSFEAVNCEPVHIKISDSFPELAAHFKSKTLKNFPKKDRIERYIKFANEMRKTYGNDFWAQYAISQVFDRQDKFSADSKNSDAADKGKVYIIDQLKTQDELNMLKSVYGKAFFQLSIYSARNRRVDYLAKYKAMAENKRDGFHYRDEAEALVNQDYNEDLSHGQKVGKIFQLADIIINADNTEEHPIEQQAGRFVELLFGSHKHSPNHMEYGMHLAHSAALRSLDLSRQVGAAIFRSTGEIATLGCNEVPKAGGGTYWCDDLDHYDAREYAKGRDNNDTRKQELLNELENILETGCENEEKRILEKIIERNKAALKNSQFMDALEYGRIVHAEMNAITDAARLGISLQDATLYCTTLPCHMCAKHIIAAGVKQVIFLEPYPKSLTSDMHPDSVKIEGASRGGYENYPFVEFSHFYGVTANRYAELFQRSKRKDEKGAFQTYKDPSLAPIFAPYERDSMAEEKAAAQFTQYFSNVPRAEPIGDL